MGRNEHTPAVQVVDTHDKLITATNGGGFSIPSNEATWKLGLCGAAFRKGREARKPGDSLAQKNHLWGAG